MSTPHCRRKHRHKAKMSPLMRSVKEIQDALERFAAQSEKENFLEFVEASVKEWRIYRGDN